MSSRNYNKLYVPTSREEGSEKILLGYQNDVRETVLTKDTETFFHIPYYTETIKLVDSTLIQDGATAGPFPAASDRIFKNRKNYGNVTTNGNPSDIADGVWFCSWLYKDEFGNVQWIDRYYNPGTFVMSIAIAQMTEGPTYKKNDPVYRDVPSTMVFEEGVQYRYFHVGEKTARSLISTFAGLSGNRIKLNLEAWGTDSVDTSLSAKEVKIVTNGSVSDLYVIAEEPDRISAPTISFNNTHKTEVSVEYDSSYALTNEFSLAFWAQSNNWNDSQSTQLVGNFSSGGGVGLFIDTLSSYPFFVIPETGYGHLLYINEGYNPFLDKSLQLTVSLTATPQFVAIDSDNNVIVCNADSSRRINKFDNAGKLLATTSLTQPTETPLQILCSLDDTIVVITDKARYTYTTDLVLLNTTIWDSISSTVAAYAYDIESGTAELISTDNVYDSKFIGTTQWLLSASDGNLYKKTSAGYELFVEFADTATNFAIDPFDRLWVLHGTNNVSVYDSKADPLSDPVFKFDAGQDVAHAQKNINFLCAYDRSTATRSWRCIIYYADGSDSQVTPQVYIFDISGNLVQTIDVLSLFNRNLLSVLKQEQKNFKFFGKGDFTGYERRRVFNNLAPFNNESQLIVRASLKDKTKTELAYKQFKAYASMGNWDSNSWQHVILTLQNRMFKLYVNGAVVAELPYSGQYELSYELQPTFFIGTPAGSQSGFNQEIGYTSAIFNGLFEDIKIYDYVLNTKTLELFQRASIPAQNMYWSLPTPSIQYIEKIERMFKNKIPGAKATYFNIKLSGTQITDLQTRAIIEQELRTIVSKIQPAYANFLRVHWAD